MIPVIDFDIRGVGAQMPRRRSQTGWIKRIGKNWVGFAYRYEKDSNEYERRRIKQHTIGSCVSMTKADATRLHHEWVAQLQSTRSDAKVAPVPTFADVWKHFSLLKKQTAWGKHYASTMSAVMQEWILPRLGERLVHSLDVHDLTQALLDMAAAGKSRNYIQHGKQAIRGVMDFAEECRWIEHNPAHSKFFIKPRTVSPTISAIPQEVLSGVIVEELRRAKNVKMLAVLAVSGMVGARRQETWVLRWNDITESHVRIDEAWKRYEAAANRIGSTKTERVRFVPIGRGAYNILQQWKHIVKPTAEDDFVFPSASRNGWPMNLDNYLRREIIPFRKKVGMPELSFRTLRKTAASLFGNDVKSAQAHLGHARPDVTAVHYMTTPTVEHVAKVNELDQSVLGRPAPIARRKHSAGKSGFVGS